MILLSLYNTLVFCYNFFKVYFVLYKYSFPASFVFHLHRISVFHSFTFSLCVSLHLQQISYRKHIDGLVFSFSSFTLKVFIDRYALMAILFSACSVVPLCAFLPLLLFLQFDDLLSWYA